MEGVARGSQELPEAGSVRLERGRGGMRRGRAPGTECHGSGQRRGAHGRLSSPPDSASPPRVLCRDGGLSGLRVEGRRAVRGRCHHVNPSGFEGPPLPRLGTEGAAGGRSLPSGRRGGLGERPRGLAGPSCPLLPSWQVGRWGAGALELRDARLWGRRGARERPPCARSFVARAFSPWREFQGRSRVAFRIFSSFPGVLFRGPGRYGLVSTRVIDPCSWSWCPGFCCSSGPGVELHRRPRCPLQ